MKSLFIVGTLFTAINSFGQTDAVRVDQNKLDSLVEVIKKDMKRIDALDDTFLEIELTFTPIIDQSGLNLIDVEQEDRLLFVYFIDPISYKITGIIDWR